MTRGCSMINRIDRIINPPVVIKELYTTSSLKDLIIADVDKKWKKWLLEKLIPEKYNETPPMEIAKLQKGHAVGRITLEPLSTGGIDLGY
jgi:hypothetical protein